MPTADTLSALLLAAMQLPPGEDRDRAIARAVDLAKRHGMPIIAEPSQTPAAQAA